MSYAYANFVMFFLLVVLGLANAPVFLDPDTAWHLASGDLIRATGAIPLHDSWSFTAQGETWYNLSWLFDSALSFIFAHGGFSAVYSLTILTFSLSATLMTGHCVRHGASPIAVLALLIPMTFVLFTGTLARPNMCSVLLTAIAYQTLHAYREAPRFRVLLILLPLVALWANLHGGFTFVFPLIGFFLVEAIIRRDHKTRRDYLAIFALCLLASLLNPYGIKVYYGAFKTLTAAFNSYLIEWKPVEIGHNMEMTALLIIVLLAGNFFDGRIALPDRLLAIFMIVMALGSLRHSLLAALLTLPYLSLRITHIMEDSKMGGRMHTAGLLLMQDMRKPDVRKLAAFMALIACAVISLPWPRDQILKEPVGFPKKHFPVKEAAFIEKHYPRLRFLNSYNIGGYLDYLWRGKVKVFVDGRANSLYSDEFLNDYKIFTQAHGFGGQAKMIASHYKLEGLIIDNNDREYGLWDWNPDWKLVYRDEVATVYLRKTINK